MGTDKHKLQVFHLPLGDEHPYVQETYERFPRNPIAGDNVSIGVTTSPSEIAERVWVTWSIEGQVDEHTAQGELVNNEVGYSYWKIGLPSFKQNQRVFYIVHACTEDQLINTEEFDFIVAGWMPVVSMSRYAIINGSLVLDLHLEDHGTSPKIQFSALDRNRLHVSIFGTDNNKVAVDEPNCLFKVIEDSKQSIKLLAGEILIECQRNPFRLKYGSGCKDVFLQEVASTDFLVRGDEILEVRQRFYSPEREAFWGFGERFNSINQRGNQIDIRVYDEYKKQGKRTYIPIPFFISSEGYGVYINSSRYMIFDLNSSQQNQWTYRAELGQDAILEYDLLIGNPKDVISTFVGLTGEVKVPPAWAFGVWISGNNWNSQAMINKIVQRTRELEIPASVLVIEAWSDESTFYIWNDARYDPKPSNKPIRYSDFVFPEDGKWPNPKEMINDLHSRSIRIILWQIPVLKHLEESHIQHDLDVEYAVQNGYCVLEENGEPYKIRPGWFKGGLVLDFTNPQAVDWWFNKRMYLVEELGVDGFKTDGGEHLFGKNLRFSNGQRGDEVWNLYPNLYIKAYHRFLGSCKKDEITFSRAGFTGLQSIPCHWAGDENSSWDAFKTSIIAGITAGASGLFFWGWDLAGFSGDIPSAELYLRSAAMAAFCPIMQYHSEDNARRVPCRDRTPWNIQERTGDECVIPTYRKFANLRMNILPYILTEAMRCQETRLPLMRGLFIEHPEDIQLREYPYQYYFGSQFLIAPVVEPNVKFWHVYLPPGEWYDFWSGDSFKGGRLIEIHAPLDKIPVFSKAGAIIPLNLGSQFTIGSWVRNTPVCTSNLFFKVFPGDLSRYQWADCGSGSISPFEICQIREKKTIKVSYSNNGIEFGLIIVCNNPHQVTLNRVEMTRVEDFDRWKDDPIGKWYWKKDTNELIAKISISEGHRELIVEY